MCRKFEHVTITKSFRPKNFLQLGIYFQLLFALLTHKMLSSSCVTGAELVPMVQRLLREVCPLDNLQLFGACRKHCSRGNFTVMWDILFNVVLFLQSLHAFCLEFFSCLQSEHLNTVTFLQPTNGFPNSEKSGRFCPGCTLSSTTVS